MTGHDSPTGRGGRGCGVSRLDDLLALHARIGLEIDRERAYQRRAAALRATVRSVVTHPDDWPMRIITMTATHFGPTATEVVGAGKRREVVDARHVAIWLLRDSGRTYVSIGRLIGRDHSTAIVAARRVERTPDLLAVARKVRELLAADEGAA